MKKYICTLFLIIFSLYFAKSQNLVGIWQEKTPDVSDAYLNTYQFYPGGNFCFNTNQYDGLRRVLTIGGTFRTEKDYLIFTIKYTIEVIGGTFERSEITTGSDSWSIEGGQTKKILLKSPIKQKAIFSVAKNTKDVECIMIDKRNYFKVDSDPNNFQ